MACQVRTTQRPWEYLTCTCMLLSISDALNLSGNSQYSRKSCYSILGKSYFDLGRSEFSTKQSCKIVRIVAKKLMAMSRLAQVYALMKFSNKSNEIGLLAFPRSAWMRATGGRPTVVYNIQWDFRPDSIQHRSDTRNPCRIENWSNCTWGSLPTQNPQDLISLILGAFRLWTGGRNTFRPDSDGRPSRFSSNSAILACERFLSATQSYVLFALAANLLQLQLKKAAQRCTLGHYTTLYNSLPCFRNGRLQGEVHSKDSPSSGRKLEPYFEPVPLQ